MLPVKLWLWFGPSPAALRYVMYFRFVDDVMLSDYGPSGSVPLPTQRRAQANTRVALHWWLRSVVLDDGGRQD